MNEISYFLLRGGPHDGEFWPVGEASTDGNLWFPGGRFATKPASFYERTEEVVQTTKGPALVMVYNAERTQNMTGG